MANKQKAPINQGEDFSALPIFSITKEKLAQENTEETFELHIDTKAYKVKPTREDMIAIKPRLQNKTTIGKYTLANIRATAMAGYSISVGVMKGTRAADWLRQQVFLVDIDNENDNFLVLTLEKALAICKKYGLKPVFFYYTFRHTEEKPKFRLGFICNEVITDENKRRLIMKTLISLFNQADKSAHNADRVFYATNKEFVILDENAKFSLDDIYAICAQEEQESANKAHENDSNLKELKQQYDFETLLRQECGEIVRETNEYILFKNCPICGHHECFMYSKIKKYFRCFGAHGDTYGSIIDYLMITRSKNLNEAIDYFKYELCGLERKAKTENKGKNKPACLETISTVELCKKNLAPIKWIVKDFLPQGTAIIASPPKYGKSWLALNLCLSVANGLPFLNFETNKGETLYLALEDSENRLKDRLEKLSQNIPISEFSFITTKAKSLSDGFIEQLEDFVKAKPKLSLIIVDTLQKIRSNLKRNELIYGYDYREISAIKEFADKHSICILLIHHLRKMKDDDPFNQISGTNGLSGSADTMIVLTKTKRNEEESTLHITGRDVEQNEYSLKFNKEKFMWERLKSPEELRTQKYKEEYNSNYIVRTVRKLLKINSQVWSGTMTDFYNESKRLLNQIPEDSTAVIGKKLRKLEFDLLNFDNIIYIPSSENGSGGKKIHKFYYKASADTC